jgi:catecholate siderophore receptor
MSHQQLPVSSPRLLASAIGMALTATSAAQMAHAAENTESKAQPKTISLDATSVTGEAQDRPPTRSRRPLPRSTPLRWSISRARSP